MVNTMNVAVERAVTATVAVRAAVGATVAASMLLLAAAPARAGTQNEWEIWCPDIYPDGDMLVGGYEVEQVIENWGPCPAEGDCDLDFNYNGYVGAVDLLFVYGHWGPCLCAGDLARPDPLGDYVAIPDFLRDAADVALLDELIASDPPIDCSADLDHNGIVDQIDRKIVLVSADGGPDSDPRADLDGDGDVDEDDLAVLDAFLGMDCRADLSMDGAVDAVDRIILVVIANDGEEAECLWLLDEE